MASGFFVMFDDVATLLQDVAAMSKVATKKTAGILGDDLAVNSEKAIGFAAKRELPVIWAITKGSLLNKLIILPLIFLLNSLAPWSIIPILMLGGLYLAYEGAEKTYEFIFPHPVKKKEEIVPTLTKEAILEHEKKKIKSAIVTDFILSLEIIILTLSTVVDSPIEIQIPVLIIVSILATLGVYGIVALIVRMDDFGFKLIINGEKNEKKLTLKLGHLLVQGLPYVIKALTIVGTIAMFLVAGGIFVHNISELHHFLHNIPALLAELLTGVSIGIVMLGVIKLFSLIKFK